MNEDTALTVSVVHACVAALANDVSTLPLRTYKAAKDRTKCEVDPPNVVSNPWPEGTLQDWLVQVMVSLTLRGNFYGQVCEREENGLPRTIKPLHPDDVTPRRNKNGQREYRYKGAVIPLADVFHIPAMLLPGNFVGLDPVAYNASSWGLASAAERFGGAFFKNSAMPGGVIEVPEDLTEEETLELARSWMQRHQGVGMAQMPAVLTGGAVWKQMSVSPDNAQFLQSRDFQRVEIAGFFGIPLHRLGLQDRTTNVGTDAESAELWYVNNTLIGWLTRIEQYFSLPTVTRQNISVKFDLQARMRANTITRYQAYTFGVNGGWLSPDDVRAREDMPDLPDNLGKKYYRPLNFATLDNIAAGNVAPNGTQGAGTIPGGSGGIGGGMDQTPDAPTAGGAKSPAQMNGFRDLVINNHQPDVKVTPEVHNHVAPAAVSVGQPVVNVGSPDVRVAPPTVNVAAPAVTVNPSTVVRTAAPDVHVKVDVPKPSVVKRMIERDRQGNITGVTEVPE